MNRCYFIFLIIILSVLCISNVSAQLYINEILAGNTHTYLTHDTKQFTDCIEIYNAGSSDVNLQGHFLTDNLSTPLKWEIFHPAIVPAKGFVVFYFDGNGWDFHVNFKLSLDGESIGLFTQFSTVVDTVTFPELLADVSYGRFPDGSKWTYFGEPTLSKRNTTDTTSTLRQCKKPDFSIKSGFYSSPVSITLTANSGETIRYTLDGSIPTSKSSLYQTPLSITQTTVVRVQGFKSNYLPSGTKTNTYFINRTSHLPVVSLSTNPEYLFSDSIGITSGTTVDNAVGADPPFDDSANYWHKWERPVHVEYFEPDGDVGFELDAGIKIFGGAFGRQIPQKAFGIFDKNKYGDDDIDYPIFSSKKITEFKRFILRASSNDYNRTFLRDGMMTTLVAGQMDIDCQAYEPALGFINGQFWGIYNLREKMNQYYPESNFGIDADDVTLYEGGGHLVQGDSTHWTNLMNYIQTHDMTSSVTYSYIRSQMDVNEYINYYIAQIYFRNHDWPVNNIKWWRSSISGKWRWLLYDLDWGFEGESREGNQQYQTNTLDHLKNVDGPPWAAFV